MSRVLQLRMKSGRQRICQMIGNKQLEREAEQPVDDDPLYRELEQM